MAMHVFSLEREQQWDPRHHVEKILGRIADGDVTVNVVRESVIIARGVITVNGFSQASIVVAGTLIKIAQFDGQPGKTEGGSVIVSRGWVEFGSTAYGTIVAAPEGANLNSTQNVTFINTAMTGRDRGGSKTVKVPDLPLGFDVKLLELSEEIHVLFGDAWRGLFVEEFRDVNLENGQNLEKGLEADLVLAVLHPAEIGLLDTDAGREFGLGEVPIFAQSSDAITH
jgi:hypothetical protein